LYHSKPSRGSLAAGGAGTAAEEDPPDWRAWNGKSADTHPYFQSVRDSFKDVVYAEGSLIFEDLFFNENFKIVDLLAKQLVDLKCDVLIG
jgi:hypothetical protein